MERVNPNLTPFISNLQVVVKNRISKVVDKSRATTLVSPKIEQEKKPPVRKPVPVPPLGNIFSIKKKKPKKSKKKKVIQTKVTKQTQVLPQKVLPKKGIDIRTERTERLVIPLTPECPNPAQNMYPRFPIPPPAAPFPVIPAGAPPVVDPITKQVYMPAFIPVPPGAGPLGQAMPVMPPFPGQQQVQGNSNISTSDLKQGHGEKERYDSAKRDDKYHSSELDYFLGGTAQYLNEKSQRKRSRSFSNRSTSSANTRSDAFRKRKRYSPDRKSRSSISRSLSHRSYERDESPGSRRYSNHSGSRSGSVYGSGRHSRSPFRSFSRERSLSPPIAASCHHKSNSRSPVSENSFRGSFLTVSEANSRDSVRDRSREPSRERSRSRYSGQSLLDEPFLETKEVSDDGNYSWDRNSENYLSPRHSYSPEREQFWDRPPSHNGDWREHDERRYMSPGYDTERYRHRTPEPDRHRTPERDTRSQSHGDGWRDHDRARHMSPRYETERYRHRTPEHNRRPPSHSGDWREDDKSRYKSPGYDTDRYRHRSSEGRTRPPSRSDWREHDRKRHVSPGYDAEKYRHRTPEQSRDRFERVIKRNSEGESIEYVRKEPHYERVIKKNCEGESIQYIRKEPHSSHRQQRHYSHQKPKQIRQYPRQSQKHDGVEKVSDVEDVSDFEEVSEFEEVSDEGSVTWEETRSEISYEVISDTEAPILKDDVKDDKPLAVSSESEDLRYDGYPNTQQVKENELEEVSDNEMPINDNDQHVIEKAEIKNVSDSATAFIKDVLAGLPSNNTNPQSDNTVTESSDNIVINQEVSNSAGDWNAVSGSAIQIYANLGLIKDENNKFVYVGQGESDAARKDIEMTTNQSENTVFDESLQGYVEALWQFPNTGILHMSYTNFIDDSEAYKDELIAEIIHIILRLDLPYVTLNKLRNAIRENIKIQLSSVEELRQILSLYPKHFILSQHAGSDSDDDDDPEIHTSKIRVNVKVDIRLCERHKALPYNKNECPCDALHICPFYLLSSCNRSACSLGHDLKTPHNTEVIKEHRLHRATLAELVEYMRNIDHRNIDTVPTICKFFNRRRGCAKDSETDDEDLCLELHLCFFFVMDNCRKGEDCELSHDFKSGQPLIVLKKFGLDPEVYGEFNILSMLRSSLRARRQVLDKLNEKIADNSLTESEVKLCIARGINPKMLQMTKSLRSHPLIAVTVQGVENKVNENQDTATPKQSPSVVNTTEESASKKHRTSLSVQMEAQKALIEKALKSKDDEKEFTNQGDPEGVIPIICKFYNNETGCVRSNEFCEFIHVCHHYVMGDCKYFDRCKRSHDLTSGQPGNILYRLGIVNMSEDEIIKVLRKLCGETLVGVDM